MPRVDMVHAIHGFFLRLFTVPAVVTLVLLIGACMAGFARRNATILTPPGATTPDPDLKTLDGSCGGYGGETVTRLFTRIGAANRRRYAVTEVTLDLLFPALYATLLAALLAGLFRAPRRQFLVLVPLMTAAADLCENFSAVYLATRVDWDGGASPPELLVRFASAATIVKWRLLAAALILILLGVAIAIGNKLLGRGVSGRDVPHAPPPTARSDATP